MKWWRLWRVRILLFLAVLGPGFITANVDNDTGGIFTYSQAGAQYGLLLLWTILPVTLALIVVQEMSARMGVVTGKGLSDLIREEFGLRMTFVMMILLVIVNYGNVVSEFSGVAASMQLFHVTKYLSVPICAAAVWALVVKGDYKSVEKVFLVASVIYLAYIAAGVVSHPDWHEALKATITLPPRSVWKDKDYIYLTIGVIGTTIAPWMQFYLQSAVVEKRVTIDDYPLSRLDVIIGCIVTDVVAFFIVLACGATIFKVGGHIEDAKDAALALRPLAGTYASGLFAFGLFNASLFAASILPLSTAYYVCEAFGWESGIDKRGEEAPQFYFLYTALIVLGAGLVLLPGLPLLKIMLLSQTANGVLLPFILIFMLLLAQDGRLMGEYRNRRVLSIISWMTVVILVALTVMMLVFSIRDAFA